ncbi:SHOCT domain-containing protein [Salinadaptatus halalkaliphilus]|uniref:SHOCT domain-containing protein n=1 Tax=Salinadaptatus halalkaliphilus TaxID=2419781 RepID=A0A4S3TTM1_9EURY|nr:SHOCT domain-containing protein [Salinadaptatus halalkaliphilus]THE66763.1 SHOCT domain-containing protein [Salinadaptatus halalkaliphilus]
MADDRPVVHLSTPAVVISVVAVLTALVALAALNTGLAVMFGIVLLVFGGEYLENVRTDLGSDVAEHVVTEPADDAGDALEVLRQRYAAGELSDDAFERKLERLVETETVADAERHVTATAEDLSGRTGEGASVGDLERERETQFDGR